MLRRQFIFGALAASLMLCAASTQAGSLDDFRRSLTVGAHRSLTGQFVAHDAAPSMDLPLNFGDAPNMVRLEPDLLAVSCERIKKTLLTQLGARDEWQGRIYLRLHRAQRLDEPIVVAPELFGNEWIYQLDVPDAIERSRLISAMVEILLLEMANRGAERSAEIPAWLSQGMSREVIFSSEEDLVIDQPRKFESGMLLSRLNRTNLLDHPLARAREDLMTMAPLSIAELSWPKEGQFDGAAGEAYGSSAQLLVHELLQLPDGRGNMRAFLPELAHHLNWQMAFLRTFHSDFSSQLDMEKWWALRLAQITGRDLAQLWRPEESWRKLDEIVRPTVEYRTAVDEMPARKQVSLQEIIRDWDIIRQTQLLREKSQQLLVLRYRVSQDLIYLVDDYRKTIDWYLKKRANGATMPMGKMLNTQRLDEAGREALRMLDVLEARRAQLRPNPQTTPAITADVNASH